MCQCECSITLMCKPVVDRCGIKVFYFYLQCLKESYVKAVGTGLGTSTAAYMRFELNTDLLSKEVCNTLPFVFSKSFRGTEMCRISKEDILAFAKFTKLCLATALTLQLF